MREIKFRALNSKKEFIYGLPYTDSVNETTYYEEYNNRMCWRDEKGTHCNQPYRNGTLSQYTGLKDKNGKEIYEGDILKGKIVIGEVYFKNGCFYFNNIYGMITPLYNLQLQNIEVIGNIYENPEQ